MWKPWLDGSPDLMPHKSKTKYYYYFLFIYEYMMYLTISHCKQISDCINLCTVPEDCLRILELDIRFLFISIYKL